MEKELVTLSNINECALEDQFQQAYPKILRQLTPGKKAKITVTIDIQRPEGSVTLVNVRSMFGQNWMSRCRQVIRGSASTP